jgi:dipeptidyl aminopeptidase/acylaminoacyl peptidase
MVSAVRRHLAAERFDKRRIIGILAVLFASCACATDPTPPPVTAFFGTADMAQPVLSPNGKHLAVLLATPAGRRQLGIIDLTQAPELNTVSGVVDADIARVRWVNDDRLVFSVADLQAGYGEGYYPGLYAVDRNGENLRELVRRTWAVSETGTLIKARELAPNHQLLRTLRDGSADVVVQRIDLNDRGEVTGTLPLRLDTRNVGIKNLDTGLDAPGRSWLVDDQGIARSAVSVAGGRATVHWRAGAGAPWQAISQQRLFGDDPGSFAPFTIGPRGELYTLAVRGDAERTTALFRFDPETLKPDAEPIVGIKGFDFDGQLIVDRQQHKLLGARFTSDAAGTAWLDPAMRTVQDKIDKLLPTTINLVDVAECNCSRWLLVTAFSDRQPPIYLMYDHEADKLHMVGRTHKAIDARQMASREFTQVAARDGLRIPLHITKPSGKGPWPAVVLVHGGPYVRGGSWEWHADSQFLASRGYLVLEPEFRGSTGYGQRLFRAGWKQWGLKMQDDIADATQWAIAQGQADAKRICIAGASYGGYATLMGLIKDPALYRCGVAWVGVSDINLLFDISTRWSDASETWKQYGMPVLVGDPEKDAEQLAATSPLKQAARLKQPLLLAYGANDRRVPIAHGSRLRRALHDGNDQVEWIEYADEGHGWSKPQNRYDFWSRVEKFLARNLAPE